MKSPARLYQSRAIRELEYHMIEEGHASAAQLMARAGEAAFRQLQQRWPQARSILVCCGKGHNAGDGYVLARLAMEAGLTVHVYALAMPEQLQGIAAEVARACLQAGVNVKTFAEAFVEADVIVDALLGIGLQGELRTEYQKAIAKINALRKPILALDVPSGVNADTGAVTEDAIQATATVTFMALKIGLFTGDGVNYTGAVHLEDLQIPPEILSKVPAQASLLEASEVVQALPRRHKNRHKGYFGHVLVMGGDSGMVGAVLMAAQGAARVGAGLVTVVTRPEHVNAILGSRPELMCHGAKNFIQLEPLLAKATTILIGPGLGQSAWSKQLLQAAIKMPVPKVIDADALNLLPEIEEMPVQSILTPHPGEAARLLKKTSQAVQQNRLRAVAELQHRYEAVIVLKGAGTIVQDFHGLPAICPAGNPGMASGGMGDLLAGVIVGLLAQGLSLGEAARVGVYVHAQAGDRAALEGGERGLLAMDLLPYLQRLVNPY